jgi:hypothetical protein
LGNFIKSFRDDFQVHSVANVNQAIAAIVSTDFSLVLCEPFLADLKSGLVSHIMDKKPALPLIITGQDDSPALNELTTLSCVKGFITRPIVRPADLAGKVVLALESLFYQGNVRGVNCITLIQIFEQECNDGTLRVINTKEKIEGLLFCKNGILLDAVCGTAAPLKAVKRIFTWASADIEVYNICPLKENRINVDLTSLILQCTQKQQPGKRPSPVSKIEKSPQSKAKPVGGLAGLFLEKAKQK